MLGVRTLSTDQDATPWLVAPARKHQPMRVAGPLPSRVQAVLAQRLFVATASLPSPLINLIKRTAAFENPEFHKKQAMRMSTARKPIPPRSTPTFSAISPKPPGAMSGPGPGLKSARGI